ncbi:MAG: CU044_2847 family protein [Streptosporangiaceae bacterium]
MATKLIKLSDGTLMEVEAPSDEVQEISGGMAASVKSKLENIGPELIKTCQPIVNAVTEMSKQMEVEDVGVEIGFSFDVEGNIYVAKAHLGATIQVRVTLKKK